MFLLTCLFAWSQWIVSSSTNLYNNTGLQSYQPKEEGMLFLYVCTIVTFSAVFRLQFDACYEGFFQQSGDGWNFYYCFTWRLKFRGTTKPLKFSTNCLSGVILFLMSKARGWERIKGEYESLFENFSKTVKICPHSVAPGHPTGVTSLGSGSCSWTAQDEALKEERLGRIVVDRGRVWVEGQGVVTYTSRYLHFWLEVGDSFYWGSCPWALPWIYVCRLGQEFTKTRWGTLSHLWWRVAGIG